MFVRLSVVVAALTLTGCIPQLTAPGFTQARTPHHRSIRVDDIPRVDDHIVLAPWNRTAERRLFRTNPADRRPHVVFRRLTPIVAPDGVRRAAWVERRRRDDGSVRRCIIHWDPQLAHQLNAGTWSHELGHCLDFPDVTSCSDPYRGVMSYCGFWSDRSGWWGADDRRMLTEAGYR